MQYAEVVTGRCSVKKLFFFATSPWCGHWLTCFAQKGYFHRRLVFFSQINLPEIRTGSFSKKPGVLVKQIKSKQVHFAEYSIIQWNTWRCWATIGSYLLGIEKEKRYFFRKQENTTKEYHCIILGKYVNLYQNN